VLGIGTLPNPTIQSQLAQLKSKGIPYVSVSSVSPVDGEMIANFTAAPEIAQAGKLTADWIIADSNADAHVAYFWDPSLSQNKPGTDAFVAEMTSACPNCSVDAETTNFLSGIGTTDPPQIVSFLQRNPNVNYLVIGIGSGSAGVAQALAAAGLAGKVKIVSRLADPSNFKNIQQGSEVMGLTEETFEAGWRMVDVLIRHMEGASFDPTPIDTIHIITKANLPADISQPYAVPNYQSYFEKAWLLSS
jgi:ABC-type sugar transport system substrate-binding protein